MLPLRQTYVFALFVLCLSAWNGVAVGAENDLDKKAIGKAHEFLKTEARGRHILGYAHFGSRYDGHSYQETRYVNRDGKRLPGHFALIYRYKWEGNGRTDLAFFCDPRGRIYDVQDVSTNALLNQPWLAANVTLKVLGNALIEAFKDKLTDAERDEIQDLVDDADARGMLVWSMKFQQALAR